jgi:predicted glycoside hydrolase/deacetylase ChbG (UPF0249 family)
MPAANGFTLGQEQPALEKYLIIHADDAGMSHSANRGTIQGLESGIVTSASIMVPCPWFLEFAEYCRKNPDGDYGIHLTLNSEWTNYRWGPVASSETVPSLVDENGYLWDNVSQVMANVKAEDADRELRAQIDKALKAGITLSHLDTHMGAVISRPDLLNVYVQLGMDYDLPVLFVDAKNPINQENPALAELAAPLQKKLLANGFPVLDQVAQFYGGESHAARRETYLDFLRTMKPGLNLLIIHCGFDDEELRAITGSAPRRDGDRRIFTDPDVAALIQQQNIQLTTWREARQRMQPQSP